MTLTKEDQQYLKLGREIARMISDTLCTPPESAAYARREITFPGGAINLFVVKTKAQADSFERLAAEQYEVIDLPQPASETSIVSKMPRRFWSESELKRLAELYPVHSSRQVASLLNRTVAGTYRTASKLGLRKNAEYLKANVGLQKGSTIGAEYRFKKGQEPPNKGLRRPGYASGRMKETQFKKGQRSHTWKPVGTILADSDGYLRIKVRERMEGDANGWNPEIWPPLHHQVWEQHKGPIPPKHIVTFKDRNKQNCDIDNLELLSMGDNARRNAMWKRFPPDLIAAIQLNGALKRKIRRAHGQEQDGRSSGSPI